MKKAFLILAYFLVQNFAFGQHRWFFGSHAGLDFSNGTVTSFNGSAMTTGEGCAVAYNGNGSLLFYTDGSTIYTSSNQIMTNGTSLSGHPSATQSAIIIPLPNSDCKKFIVFTVDAAESSLAKGLNYSVVDFSSNPNGEVLAAHKNIRLLPNELVAEKLTAVQKSDGSYWVIAHNFQNDANTPNANRGGRFYAFNITNSNLPLNITPVISTVGTIYQHTGSNLYTMSQGQMKISNDKTRLALAVASGGNRANSCVELFDFNINTGQITNPVKFNVPEPLATPFGVEFSPNGRYLYVSFNFNDIGFNGIKQIKQIDLNSLPPNQYNLNTPHSSIRDFLTNQTQNYIVNALQLGPDGNIYCATNNNWVGRVNNPNLNTATFTVNAVNLGSGSSKVGLPTLIQGENNCRGTNDIPTPAPIPCCSPRNTLLEFGNIEKYEAKIQSEFIPNQASSTNRLRPGQYWVANAQTVGKICENWSVGGKNCEDKGDFLVFNGRTGGTGKLTAWRESIKLKEGNYRFCTQFKNFPQCCFDVKPQIEVRVTAANGAIISSEIYNVDLGSDPCKWLDIQQSFSVTDAQNPVKIEVLLDQTGQGDGNDFAMNDAYLSPISAVNLSSQVAFLVEKIPGSPLTFRGNITQSAGYNFQWSVVEMQRTGTTLTEIPSTKVVNGWSSNPTMFNGYNGTAILSGTGNGAFNPAKIYRFICTFSSSKNCAEYSEAWIYEPNAQKAVGSPTQTELRKDTTYKALIK